MGANMTELSKLRLTRKEAATLLGISTRHLDYRVRTGALKAVRDGSRIFLTPTALRQYASRDQVMEKGEALTR